MKVIRSNARFLLDENSWKIGRAKCGRQNEPVAPNHNNVINKGTNCYQYKLNDLKHNLLTPNLDGSCFMTINFAGKPGQYYRFA